MMRYLPIIAIAVVVLGVIFYRSAQRFHQSTGTVPERVMAVFDYSLTILWARIVAFAGVLLGVLATFGDYLMSSTDLQNTVKDLFPPEWVPWYLFIIAVVFEYLRRRPLPVNYPPVVPPSAPVDNPPDPGPR